MRLCRIIPRFSLRTLVVFLLLVTAVTAFILRRARWVSVLEVRGENELALTVRSDREPSMALTFRRPRFRRRGGGRSIPPAEAVVLLGQFFGAEPAAEDETLEVPVTSPMLADADIRVIEGLPESRGRGLAFRSVRSNMVATGTGGRLTLWRPTRVTDALRRLEFWLTVALGAVFVWSVVRDRRVLKVAAAEEEEAQVDGAS